MPEVFRQDGFRFFFYSNEGDPREPMHVHVRKGGSEAKVWIAPVSICDSDGFDPRSLRDIVRMVEANLALIQGKWHDYFS